MTTVVHCLLYLSGNIIIIDCGMITYFIPRWIRGREGIPGTSARRLHEIIIISLPLSSFPVYHRDGRDEMELISSEKED